MRHKVLTKGKDHSRYKSIQSILQKVLLLSIDKCRAVRGDKCIFKSFFMIYCDGVEVRLNNYFSMHHIYFSRTTGSRLQRKVDQLFANTTGCCGLFCFLPTDTSQNVSVFNFSECAICSQFHLKHFRLLR